ncbi:aconitate hydratase [Steroidobacter denitrificans]|uniref:Aconitate hydratase n=1 Tax=Steroidobacter denitrificans TaxID=465721 RepID=A0A127FBV4_STEDE|nr:aconitate hydratase AcnA [Steroidobacter denitrificans]AMN47078.1 aconitate hydratase [Steroidobacter denitrificans]
MKDSFKARTTLACGSGNLEIFSLTALQDRNVGRLPFSLKILLENLLRFEDGVNVTRADIEALLSWDPKAAPAYEISFSPSRVIMQDFTGVPAVVDLAAMREAMTRLGGNPDEINPLSPAELVIDHSVQVDVYGTPDSLAKNNAIEFERNAERYSFLRWGQGAFSNFKVVPPNTGIVHQVNIEHLARVVFDVDKNGTRRAYPDTLVGTDSHTTMVNGLGVLGWGVGGIEAEAVMLGQPITMLIPHVIGVKLTGSLPAGTTATDLVLTVTEMLRKKGVVDKFVEFFGDGLASLPLADRATIANMSPEFGSTCAIFPIDNETLRYLELTGRGAEHIALVKAYAQHQGLWRENGQPQADYTDVVELNLDSVESSLAGPKRPQDRVPLRTAKPIYQAAHAKMAQERSAKNPAATGQATVKGGQPFEVKDGAVLIAAITSCTNTSNPAVLVAAGLLARNARRLGLTSKPWVKTSIAPGSRVVTDYLEKAGLTGDLEALGFYTVGYGCTTCIGNSGPLKPEISEAVRTADLIACSVLSGNRNFEGRVHPEVKMNFLASPPLVVAYALAGTLELDLTREPLGTGKDGKPVYLKDIWPTQAEIQEVIAKSLDAAMFKRGYSSVFAGDEHWNSIKVPAGKIYAWDEASTYVKNPPYFVGMTMKPDPVADIRNARALALLGDSVTTDHISPAGNIAKTSPAAQYLMSLGVQPKDFNSYGSRRGNHEVMMRGTFANIRLRNELAPGTEGGITVHVPSGEQMSIYDAAMRYRQEGTPLVILAGKEYGTGSSRDWAAKGTMLLGVKAVIAESFERIHRSNLIGMGVLPLQFKDGQSAQSLGLTGKETFEIIGLNAGAAKKVTVVATPASGAAIKFEVLVRIDTPKEREYFQHGGILHYVLRQLASSTKAA